MLTAAPAGFGVDSPLELVPVQLSAKLSYARAVDVGADGGARGGAGDDIQASCPAGPGGLGLGTLDRPDPNVQTAGTVA
jgi:hypothetical protein